MSWLRVGQVPGWGVVTDAASVAKDAAAKGRAIIEQSDAIVDELDEPLTSAALALQERVFDLADVAGVGDEVRALVYAIRTFEYASPVTSQLAAGPIGAAVATTLGSIGSFGALAAGGVVAGAIALVSGLFGGDDEEDAKARRKRRRERLEKTLRHLLERLSLEGFALDQEDEAAQAEQFASWHKMSGGVAHFSDGTSANYPAQAAQARKLATFFRLAQAQLPAVDRALFVSLLNLGRWSYALQGYRSLSPAKREYVSSHAHDGKGPVVDYGERLELLLTVEQKFLRAMVPAKRSPWLAVGLVALVAAGALAVLYPATLVAALSATRAAATTSLRRIAT